MWGLFVIYLLVLAWVILLKMQVNLRWLPRGGSVNLVPFAMQQGENLGYHLREMGANLLIFVPFGLYLGMLKGGWPLWKRIVPIVGTSLLFEVLQYVLSIGTADVTDVVMNALGGVVGMLVAYGMKRLLKDRAMGVFAGIAVVGTVLVLALAGLVIAGVFRIRVR